jgi:hypothetical protein
VADAFLTLPPEDRDTVNDFFADCRDLERAHRGHISPHAAGQLRATRDAVWLRRGIVVAGLGKGGTDYRDLVLSLNDLWDAARAVGLDPGLAFRQIGGFVSAKPGKGGLNMSVREFLTQFRR